jgi:hypothetical protein
MDTRGVPRAADHKCVLRADDSGAGGPYVDAMTAVSDIAPGSPIGGLDMEHGNA